MPKKDPYYTYTDYGPVPPVVTRPSKVGWTLLAVVILAILALAAHGTFWLVVLQGGPQ